MLFNFRILLLNRFFKPLILSLNLKIIYKAFLSQLNAFITLITTLFCSGVRLIQLSNNSFNSGESSTVSLSAKNCDNVIPKPLQIVCRVLNEGHVFLLKIFANVDSDNPHSFESLYSVQPRSFINLRNLLCISVVTTSL